MGGCLDPPKGSKGNQKLKGTKDTTSHSTGKTQPSSPLTSNGVRTSDKQLFLELPSSDQSGIQSMSNKNKESQIQFSFHLGGIQVKNGIIQLEVMNFQPITVLCAVKGKYFYNQHQRLSCILDCDCLYSEQLSKKPFSQRGKSVKISFNKPSNYNQGRITVILDANFPNKECLYLRYTYELQNDISLKLVQPVIMQWCNSTYKLK